LLELDILFGGWMIRGITKKVGSERDDRHSMDERVLGIAGDDRVTGMDMETLATILTVGLLLGIVLKCLDPRRPI
jgi:hypothetical protein